MPQYATLYLQYCMGHAYNASHRITRFSWRRWGDLRIDLWSEDNTKALYRRSLAGWMFGKCCMPRMGGSFSKLERFILGQKYKHTHTQTCFPEPFCFFLWASQMRYQRWSDIPHALWNVMCEKVHWVTPVLSTPSFTRAAARHRRAAYSVREKLFWSTDRNAWSFRRNTKLNLWTLTTRAAKRPQRNERIDSNRLFELKSKQLDSWDSWQVPDGSRIPGSLLRRLEEARGDLSRLIQLEPSNREASCELEKHKHKYHKSR